MKFQKINKVHEGKFITRFDIGYELSDGSEKNYEIISRSKDLAGERELLDSPVDSVILMVTDEEGERILLNREFRMATGRWVVNFPAGLIDPGETPREAAARELREETGLEAAPGELQLLHTVRVFERFVDTYLLRRAVNLEELKLQKCEVSDAKLVTFDELSALFHQGEVMPRERFPLYCDLLCHASAEPSKHD